MHRTLSLFLAVLLVGNCASMVTAQPTLDKKAAKAAKTLIPLLEWGDWLLKEADELSKEEKEMLKRLNDRGFRGKAQVVAGILDIDVVVEQTTSYWRGSVSQELTMPCTATLAVDVATLRKNTFFNPATKTIEIYIPPLSVIAVEAHTSRYTTSTAYEGGCWRWYDHATADRMEVSLLKSDWSAIAHTKVDPSQDRFRKAAKNGIIELLGAVTHHDKSGLKIVVKDAP